MAVTSAPVLILKVVSCPHRLIRVNHAFSCCPGVRWSKNATSASAGLAVSSLSLRTANGGVMSFLFAFAADCVFGWTIISRVRFFPASGACRLGRAVEASVSFSALESSARSPAVLRCRPRSYYWQLVSCFAHVPLRADVRPFFAFCRLNSGSRL